MAFSFISGQIHFCGHCMSLISMKDSRISFCHCVCPFCFVRGPWIPEYVSVPCVGYYWKDVWRVSLLLTAWCWAQLFTSELQRWDHVCVCVCNILLQAKSAGLTLWYKSDWCEVITGQFIMQLMRHRDTNKWFTALDLFTAHQLVDDQWILIHCAQTNVQINNHQKSDKCLI